MKLQVISAAVATLMVAACSTTPQPTSGVPDAGKSMTDEAIFRDHQDYAAQQGRIKAQNDTGRNRVASYSLAKAQCWLDVSLHEYSRNDRSGFPSAAYSESFKITDYLGKGGNVAAAANPAMQTPLVNDAAKLRPDLWDAANALKSHPGWRCAEQKTACAEVELVHAGNEFNQQQWRQAKPYVQIAEDLIGDAQRAAEACRPAPVAPVAAPVVVPTPGVTPRAAIVPTPVAPSVAVIPVAAAANVLFNFDKRDMPNVRPYTKDQLDALIAQARSASIRLSGIKLIGHADRLNSTGDANYNVKLSQDRVEVIKGYLISGGIPASVITTDFKADTVQIEACTKNKFRSTVELQECLLPNRRVEVLLSGVQR